MRCPHCAVALADPDEHDPPFRLLRCADHGAFVSGEDLEPAMVQALKRDIARAPVAKVECPMCGSGMRERVSHGSTLDVCAVCDGVWFDKGELERAPRPAPRRGPGRWTATPLDAVADAISTETGRPIQPARPADAWKDVAGAILEVFLRWP